MFDDEQVNDYKKEIKAQELQLKCLKKQISTENVAIKKAATDIGFKFSLKNDQTFNKWLSRIDDKKNQNEKVNTSTKDGSNNDLFF